MTSPRLLHPHALSTGQRRPVPSRLAFVTSTPLSVGEGSGTYVAIRQLVRSLEARGVGVEMHAPIRLWPGYTARRLWFNLRVAPRLRQGRYDWVVGFDLDGFVYGRRPAVPYVASIKGVVADELRNERGIVRALLGLQAGCERLAVRRAQVVVATSRYSRDRIVEAYGIPAGKIVIVPEPIDLLRWREQGNGPAPANPPAILSVAHMYPRKNLERLLQAFAELSAAGVPFQGWIVGDGPRRRAWERLRDRLGLGGAVQFLGTLPWRELRERYGRAALFCLPSRQEGFGIVFVEAMASGLPVVAARAAAVPETVAEGETALLVEPDDPRGLAEALARLLTDSGLRREFGAAGRRRAERFEADRVAGEFLAAVEGALEGTEAGLPGLAALSAVGSGGPGREEG